MKFIDEVSIDVEGGHGGRGIVSFESEKFRPKGGPNGGNGGQGGNVYIRAHSSLSTLSQLLQKRKYKAQNGLTGKGRKQSGANGNSLELLVPVGTEIFSQGNEGERQLLVDLSAPGHSYLAVSGGIGGLGNYNFATSTKQKPEHAQPGRPGQVANLLMQLKLIADVGLVGLPNAGKSTLLSSLSQKKAEIADYHFTTLTPNIGVVENKNYRRLFLADIPGIISGASRGVGLGLSFLKHIERVSVIIYLLDGDRFDFYSELTLLQKELYSYNPNLLTRPALVVVNKCDLLDYDISLQKEIQAELKRAFQKKYPTIDGISKLPDLLFLSAKEKKGLLELKEKLFSFFCGGKQSYAERALG